MGQLLSLEEFDDVWVEAQEVLAEQTAHSMRCIDCATCKAAGQNTDTEGKANFVGIGYCPDADCFIDSTVHPADLDCYEWSE